VRVRDATATQEFVQDQAAQERAVAIVARGVFDLGHPPETVYRPLEPPFAARVFFAWPPAANPLQNALVSELRSAPAEGGFVASPYESKGRNVLSSVSRRT